MQNRLASILLIPLALVLTAACSESTDGAGAGAGGDASTTTSSTGSQTSTTSSTSAGTGGDETGDPVVAINEISATDDWVELVNLGPGTADLSDWSVADQDAPGAPKLDEALVFPQGTSLEEGDYLLIVAKVDAPEPGPQTTCLPDGGPATCHQAMFGISDASGDAIFLIEPGGEIATQVDYPAGDVDDGESWARTPDGTGDFESAAPTPGAVNDP